MLLDRVGLSDPADSLLGDGLSLGPVHVHELAPDIDHADDLADHAAPVQVVEAGIAVGVHRSSELGEMIDPVSGLSVDRKLVPSRWRRPRHSLETQS